MSTRGFTLIEQMIAVAIMGIASGAVWNHIDTLQTLTVRQTHREAVVRALENDLEEAVACADRACLQRWADNSYGDDGESWSYEPRARLLSAGPGGTWKVEVLAKYGERTIGVWRLVAVAR